MTRKWPTLVQRIAPLCLIFFVSGLFVALGGTKYLNLDQVALLQGDLIQYVSTYPVRALLIFAAVYTIVSVSLLPGLLILDLVAGFLFVQPIAFLLVLFANVLGGVILFTSARNAFRDLLKDKGGNWIKKIQKGFNKYQDGYLVFLRVFPFFPFGMISIALGFTKIRFSKFLWTTALGSLPSVYILTSAGGELKEILKEGFTTALFLTPKIFIVYALSVIAVLAPLFIKRKRKIETAQTEDYDQE